MPEETVTLALDGDVRLGDFSAAMSALGRLVEGLSESIAPDVEVTWYVDHLDSGSAVTTLRAEAEDVDALARISAAFLAVGQSLEAQQAIPYSPAIDEPARTIVGLLDGFVTGVRFETAEAEAVVHEPIMVGPALVLVPTDARVLARGSVEGVIQTLTNRRGLRFTLYDTRFDKPVSCYLRQGQEELVRDLWGQRAVVGGLISRDPKTGRPLSIRQVTEIEPIAETDRAAYRSARLAAPLGDGEELPENRIRRLRDDG